GGRLRWSTISSADGMRGPSGYIGGDVGYLSDSQVGSGCHFSETADGNERCIPFFATTVGDYADSSCTQPVIIGGKSWTGPTFGYDIDARKCPMTTFYRSDANYTGTTSYERAATGCTGGHALDPTVNYYNGSPFPITGFELGASASAGGVYRGFQS